MAERTAVNPDLGASPAKSITPLEDTPGAYAYQDPLTGLEECIAVDIYTDEAAPKAPVSESLAWDMTKMKINLTATTIGCGGDGDVVQEATPAEETKPAHWTDNLHDTLVVAESSDFGSVVPLVYDSVTDRVLVNLTNFTSTGGRVYAPGEDPELCGYVPEPELATSWQWIDDTTFEIVMRGDIRWHDADNEFIDEEDWQFTFDLINNPVVITKHEGDFDVVDNNRPEITTLEDGSIRMVYRFASPGNQELYESRVLAVKPAPYHALKDYDLATLKGSDFNKHPTASGRWMIESVEQTENITIVPNPNYTGGDDTPRLKRIKIRILPDYATQLVELERGGIDYLDGILVNDVERLKREHPEINIHVVKDAAMDFVAWNLLDRDDFEAKKNAAEKAYERRVAEIDAMSISDAEKEQQKEAAKVLKKIDTTTVKASPLFGDLRVRQALAHGVNAQKMVDDLLSTGHDDPQTGDRVITERYGRTTTSTIAPYLCGKYNEDITPFSFDPAKAKQMLKDAGWEDTNSNGTIDKMIDGALVEFEFTLTTNSENKRRNRSAVIMQAQLKELGIEMNIEQVEFNTAISRLREKSFDAGLLGWGFGTYVDPSYIWAPDSELNYPSFVDAELAEKMEIYANHPDAEVREQALRDFQAILYENQAYFYVANRDDIIAIHERFKYGGEGPMFSPTSSYSGAHEWYVDPEDVKYKR